MEDCNNAAHEYLLVCYQLTADSLPWLSIGYSRTSQAPTWLTVVCSGIIHCCLQALSVKHLIQWHIGAGVAKVAGHAW